MCLVVNHSFLGENVTVEHIEYMYSRVAWKVSKDVFFLPHSKNESAWIQADHSWCALWKEELQTFCSHRLRLKGLHLLMWSWVIHKSFRWMCFCMVADNEVPRFQSGQIASFSIFFQNAIQCNVRLCIMSVIGHSFLANKHTAWPPTSLRLAAMACLRGFLPEYQPLQDQPNQHQPRPPQQR